MPTSLRRCTSPNASECSGRFTVVKHVCQPWLNQWACMSRSSAMRLPKTLTCRSARTSSRLRTEMPDEVELAPSCHLWSQMQNLAARSDTQQHELYLKRKQHHACHLMFVAKVYKEEVDNARHAHIEQPEKAQSWRATAFKDLPRYWIVRHQCMFGCACLEQDGWWKLVKKPTGILPRKVSMQAALSKL